MVCNFSDFQTFKFSKFESLKVWSLKVWSLKTVQNLKSLKFESLKVWKFESLKVWNFESLKVRKFEKFESLSPLITNVLDKAQTFKLSNFEVTEFWVPHGAILDGKRPFKVSHFSKMQNFERAFNPEIRSYSRET